MDRGLNSSVAFRTGIALLALLASASTCESSCENRDFTAIEVHEFDLKPGEQLLTETYNPYNGRMTVDFVVTNDSTVPFELTLIMEDIQIDHSDESSSGDVGEADGGGQADAGTSEAYVPPQRVLELEPGERAVGIFGDSELASGIGVRVGASCEGARPCLGTLQYSVLVTQHQCRSDSQCGSGTNCDISIGRCVGAQCTKDKDCPTDQICDALAGESGYCTEVGVICASLPSAPPRRPSSLLVGVALVALAVVAARRRR